MNKSMAQRVVSNNWLRDTLQMVVEMGYRVTPVYASGSTKPFANGQTYTDLSDYKDAVHIGVVLDNAVLLDYDGNKTNGIMSVPELAFELGLDELPDHVQQNKEGDSLHYLFRWPDHYTPSQQSNDGCYLGIDIKTGNQLMHLKQHKILSDSEVPRWEDLPPAPQALMDLMSPPPSMHPSDQRHGAWHGRPAEIDEAREILSHIDPDLIYGKWLSVLTGLVAKFGDGPEASQLAIEWSEKGSKFKSAKEVIDKLRTIASARKGQTNIGWGSVCHIARENGADLSAIARSHVPSFNELIQAAEELTTEDDPSLAVKMCKDAVMAGLDKIQKEKLLRKMSETSGLTMATLDAQVRDVQKTSSASDLDQLGIAKKIVDEFGPENLIGVPENIYYWPDTGVWKVMQERKLKQEIQHFLPNEMAEVEASDVRGIAELFQNHVFTDNHTFNVGPQTSVNCLNGELTYAESGDWELTAAVREHYRTTQIPVSFDPVATCPKFDHFLGDVFSGDSDTLEKQQAILEMMGYSLMAHCKYEKFCILVGTGANGKSVLLSVLEQLCGKENCAGVQPSQFDRSFQRAHLGGKLVNIVTEVKQGEVIDDASLKGIVSGEPTTVEHKFKDPFVMRPFSTCWFGTNHMPHTRDFSDALFRRALVVPFNKIFKPELGNCNPNLKYELFEELPGILNRALDAYSSADARGSFTLPASCLEAREDWRKEADQVAHFVEDNCTVDVNCRETSAAMFSDYLNWAEGEGIGKRMSKRGLTQRLNGLGFASGRTPTARTIEGLKINGRVAAGDTPAELWTEDMTLRPKK